MLHTTSCLGADKIAAFSPFHQLLVTAAFSLKMLAKTSPGQKFQFLLRPISRIRPHIVAGIGFIQKSFEDLTIMSRGGRNVILADRFMLHIHLNMILIAMMVFAILLDPAGIRILLAFLVLAPAVGNLALLDLFISIQAVSLPGAGIILASIICPFLAANPLFRRNASNRSNRGLVEWHCSL